MYPMSFESMTHVPPYSYSWEVPFEREFNGILTIFSIYTE